MSLRINNNVSALNAHRNLKTNDDQLSRTIEKLSSGLQVTRAADGPAKLVISEQMRAQIGGLQQAIDNSETAVSLVQTTEANLNEITSLLTGIRQLAIHAANEGTNNEVMLEADQDEIRNALDTINRISMQAQFGKKRLLDGSNGVSGFTSGENLAFEKASLATRDSSRFGFDVTIKQAATQSEIRGETALTDEIVKEGETLAIIENGRMAKYTSNQNDTADTAVQNLRSEIERNGLDVDVWLDESNRITVNHRQYGSDFSFRVASSTDGVLSKVAEVFDSAAMGEDVMGTINGESAVGKGQILTGIKGAKSIDGLSVRYTGGERNLPAPKNAVTGDVEEVPDETANVEIPETGMSVGRVFVSQKSLKFQVGANQGQVVGISLQNTNADNLARGISNDSGFRNLNEIDVRTFEGAIHKNTLESNLSNLRVANENLISAESIIRDADMASELAEFTKRRIMAQAANAMLAQANQTPPKVLQLLQ